MLPDLAATVDVGSFAHEPTGGRRRQGWLRRMLYGRVTSLLVSTTSHRFVVAMNSARYRNLVTCTSLCGVLFLLSSVCFWSRCIPAAGGAPVVLSRTWSSTCYVVVDPGRPVRVSRFRDDHSTYQVDLAYQERSWPQWDTVGLPPLMDVGSVSITVSPLSRFDDPQGRACARTQALAWMAHTFSAHVKARHVCSLGAYAVWRSLRLADYCQLCLGFLVITSGAAMPLLISRLVRHTRIRMRVRRCCCARCGYNLAGSDGKTCPECGLAFS